MELYGLRRGLCFAIQFEYMQLHIVMDTKIGVDIISLKCYILWRVMNIGKKVSMLEEFEIYHVW